MNVVNIFVQALQQLVIQLTIFLPKVVVAILIWYVGKYFLNLAVRLVKRIDIKKTKLDNKAIDFLTQVTLVVGKIILVLIVLDFLGIGRTIISALASGLTIAIAVALGIAFGKALEKDASNIVSEVKKHLRK